MHVRKVATAKTLKETGYYMALLVSSDTVMRNKGLEHLIPILHTITVLHHCSPRSNQSLAPEPPLYLKHPQFPAKR